MSSIPGKWVESVFRKVLVADLTPELVSQLAAVGVELSGPSHLYYSKEVWYQAIELTAQALFPGQSLPEQLRRLGAHLIRTLESRRLIKGPWLTMARLMGPRRALKQAMDFVERSPVPLSLEERSKTEFDITAEETRQPEFLVGLLEATLEMLGAKSPQVTLKATSAGSSLLRASWR